MSLDPVTCARSAPRRQSIESNVGPDSQPDGSVVVVVGGRLVLVVDGRTVVVLVIEVVGVVEVLVDVDVVVTRVLDVVEVEVLVASGCVLVVTEVDVEVAATWVLDVTDVEVDVVGILTTVDVVEVLEVLEVTVVLVDVESATVAVVVVVGGAQAASPPVMTGAGVKLAAFSTGTVCQYCTSFSPSGVGTPATAETFACTFMVPQLWSRLRPPGPAEESCVPAARVSASCANRFTSPPLSVGPTFACRLAPALTTIVGARMGPMSPES
jgi:hypothetical protein